MSEQTVSTPVPVAPEKESRLARFKPSKKTLAIVATTAATVLAGVGLYAKGRKDDSSPLDDYIPVDVTVETLSDLTATDK